MSNALIYPFLYEFDISHLQNHRLVTYIMPMRAYEALKRAQDIDTNRNADIRGLDPLLAWAAPEVDRAFIDRIDRASPAKSIHFWMYAPQKELEVLKRELLTALTIWIGLVAPSEKNQILGFLSDERSSKTAWKDELIDTQLAPIAVCASPTDNRVFDLLTVHAARQLERIPLIIGGTDRGLLVPTGPRQQLYAGKTLLRFAPHEVESRKKEEALYHWTEVFNVTAVTTPEQQHLRVAISVSIRNFVPIHQSTFTKDKSRYVDVFINSAPHLSSGPAEARAIGIPIKRADFVALRQENAATHIKASPSLSVLQRLLSLHGQPRLVFTKNDQLAPLIDDRISIYPRGGSGHGDRNLPGGTGIGAPDRKDYLDFLDDALGKAGFNRVPMERRTPSRKVALKRLSDDDDLEPTLVRQSLIRALKHVNGSPVFNIALLISRTRTISAFYDALVSLLGEPTERGDYEWKYPDNLTVRVTAVAAGPFAARLDDPEQALTGLNLSQIKRRQVIRKSTEDAANSRLDEMAKYLDQLPQMDGIWAAIVEMDEKVADEARRDPYNLVYKAVAERSGIAQVVLFNPEEDPDESLAEATAHRLRSALRDVLRSFGTCYVDEDAGQQSTVLQGWWVINLNSDRFDQRAGARKGGAVTPVAVRYSKGVLDACLMYSDGTSAWQPYPRMLITLELGKNKDLADMRQKELANEIGQFFARVSADVAVETVVFCDATNIRQYLPDLGNANLRFDDLRLGEVGGAAPSFEVKGGQNMSILRLSTESAKSPTYWVSENKQGVASGMFGEPGALRTYWVSRGLPTSLQTHAATRKANTQSRYYSDEQEKPNLNYRRFPSLSEVCIIVQGNNADPGWLASLTRRAMEIHATTDESTILPFPLHEARLLANASR